MPPSRAYHRLASHACERRTVLGVLSHSHTSVYCSHHRMFHVEVDSVGLSTSGADAPLMRSRVLVTEDLISASHSPRCTAAPRSRRRSCSTRAEDQAPSALKAPTRSCRSSAALDCRPGGAPPSVRSPGDRWREPRAHGHQAAPVAMRGTRTGEVTNSNAHTMSRVRRLAAEQAVVFEGEKSCSAPRVERPRPGTPFLAASPQRMCPLTTPRSGWQTSAPAPPVLVRSNPRRPHPATGSAARARARARRAARRRSSSSARLRKGRSSSAREQTAGVGTSNGEATTAVSVRAVSTGLSTRPALSVRAATTPPP